MLLICAEKKRPRGGAFADGGLAASASVVVVVVVVTLALVLDIDVRGSAVGTEG